MFEFVRKHTKVMQFLLFLLIVPSFVLFGLQGYNRYRERGETVARVDGNDITQQDWDNAHKAQVDRMREQMPNLDPKVFDSPEARYGTLQRMVRERVLQAAVQHDHLMVGDQRVARELQSNEVIQALRGPDGRLDLERYRELLAARGMTPEMFENQVRNDLAVRQVLAGVAQSSFAAPAQADVTVNSVFERREVQVARFAANDYKARVQPTDAELQAYYKAHEAQYQAPEQADIQYVVLDLASVATGVKVDEADLKNYYDQNASRLGNQEERRASHILIAVPKGASAEEKAKAKAKAEEILAQVKKNPGSFAELAKKESQDPGSAPNGGDLDFFTRGAMTKPFEDAVFAMKAKGDISGVVETEFGYHIIKLTDIKPAQRKSFEEMKPQLEADVRKQLAQKKFAEAAETFSNTVYEQSDSLKPVADKLKLQVRTADAVTRAAAPGATGPLASPKFLQALFSPDAVDHKRNTEAVEFGPNQLASGRIVKHVPAHTRPFDEVKAQVKDLVVAQRAAELARKDGEAKLAAWKATPASASLPAPVTLSRQDMAGQPRPVVEAALRADAAKLPALVGVDLGAEGYAIVKVDKVLSRQAPTPQQAQQELAQYANAWSNAEAQAYYELLKDRFKAQINVPKPAGTPAQ